MTSMLKTAAAIAAAAAIAVSAPSGTMAAPIGTGPLTLKEVVPSDIIDVSRRGRRNTAVALGVLGGLWLGSTLAYPRYYRGPGPRVHAYGPGYYYGYPQCWYQVGPRRHQGFWDYC